MHIILLLIVTCRPAIWFRDIKYRIFVTCNTQGANLNEDNCALNVIVWHERTLNQQRCLEEVNIERIITP